MNYEKWFEDEFPQIKLNPPGSIYADTAWFIVNLIRENKPSKILELGSGVSTAMMGLEVKKYGGSVFSVEHEEAYIPYSREICEKAGFKEHNINHAALKDGSYDGVKPFQSYDKSVIPSDKFDFAFIDGPPGFKPDHPFRRGTLYTIWDALADESFVILDDGDREGERLAVLEWMTVFGDQLTVQYKDFKKPGFFIQVKKK